MTHTCPICGEPAIARIRPSVSCKIQLESMYRHNANGWVYLHPITDESLPEPYQ